MEFYFVAAFCYKQWPSGLGTAAPFDLGERPWA
jgi:hypothetical protein